MAEPPMLRSTGTRLPISARVKANATMRPMTTASSPVMLCVSTKATSSATRTT
jgi:hypothetical protein